MTRSMRTVAAAFVAIGLLASPGTAGTTATTITITSAPDQISTSGTASFEFTVTPSQDLRCILDGKENPTGVCTSPQTYTGLANGKHWFVVEEYTPTSTGPTSASRRWVIRVPLPDTTITGGPSGTVADRTATFTFTSDQDGATFECSIDGAEFAPCESGAPSPELGLGPHTFAVRATTQYGTDDTPDTRQWTIANPPDTTITSGPSGGVAARNATFTFKSVPPGASFECSLDGKTFEACTSPRTDANLIGDHDFRVRAVSDGLADATPAERKWFVRTGVAAPDTIVTSRPAASTTERQATIAFRSDPAGASFDCRLNGGTFAPCSSPDITPRLELGAQRFFVRAVARGVTDPTPAEVDWAVAPAAATPPDTVITREPSGATHSRSAEFEFESRPPGAGFQCSLDGQPFAVCASPADVVELTHAIHRFRVRAVRLGRVDPTPAVAEWRVTAGAGTARHWRVFGGGAGAVLAAVGAFFWTRRRAFRIRLHPFEVDAGDEEPPPSCRVPETYTWRRNCKLKPALRQVEKLHFTARAEDGSVLERDVGGDTVARLNQAVRARRLRRGKARLRTLVAPAADALVAEIERWLADHADTGEVEIDAELKGGKLECEFTRYECVPRGDACGWEELERWKGEVDRSSTVPVARLGTPMEPDAGSRLAVALLPLVERVDVPRRAAHAPEVPAVPHT